VGIYRILDIIMPGGGGLEGARAKFCKVDRPFEMRCFAIADRH